MKKVCRHGLLYCVDRSPGAPLSRALEARLARRPVGAKGAKGIGEQRTLSKALIELCRLGKARHEHGKLVPVLEILDDFKALTALPKGHHRFVEVGGKAAV